MFIYFYWCDSECPSQKKKKEWEQEEKKVNNPQIHTHTLKNNMRNP